jgi:hypothetical protein
VIRRLLVASLVAAGLLAVPSPAHAAARISITSDGGGAVADPTYATTLTLRGSGFQAIKGGYGGVYVFFGTVKGAWKPSQGGVTGQDYLYVPDSESKDNQGYQRFIAFEGSDTESAAQGVMRADGTWSAQLKVPGASFETVDRDGDVASVDCRRVTCGVITIGAHGVKNARNETFTPVRFESLYDEAPVASAAPSSPPSSAAPAVTEATAPESAAPAAPAAPVGPGAAGPAAAVVDADTAMVGRVLSFTGSGFTPGEQVTASFDHGRAAVGPLSAGASGEVAGVLQLPADVRAGTHTLRLTGAASSSVADLNFPVAASDDPSPAAAPPASPDPTVPAWVGWAFLGAAALVLLLALVVAVRRFRRSAPGVTRAV